MALTQITTDGIKDGTITGSDLATNIDLVDNQKLRLGTGNDLQIYHDGTNSNLKNTTGTLYVAGDVVTLTNSAISELYFKGTANGAVELYYDNVKKFETTSYGAKFTDNVLFNNPDTTGRNLTWEADNDALHWEDNTKATFGASNDLQIFHDSNNSFIRDLSGTGNLKISSNQIDVVNAVNSEFLAKFIENGAVELYHNNIKRFETTSGGVLVTGSAQFTGNIFGNDNFKFISGASSDLQIYHDGSNSYLYQDGTGELRANAATFRVMDRNGGETQLLATQNGAVELYHNNVKKLETTSSGVQLGGDLDTNSNHILLNDTAQLKMGASNDFIIRHNGTDNTLGGNATTKFYNPLLEIYKLDGTKKAAAFNADGSQELYYNNDRVFYTETRGVRIGDNTKIFENSSHNTAIMQHADIHHAIILRGSSNADGSTITNANVTTFREYGNFVFMTGASNMGTRLTIAQNGSIGAPSGTNIYNASDSRLKKNVVTLDKGLDAIKALRPVSFNWIDGFCDEEKDTLYGFVAQEAQTVDSNLVAPFGGDVNIGDDPENPDQIITDPLRVNEKYIVPMLVKAIQELTAKVEALEAG